MDSVSGSSVSSFQKYGIPETKHPEITLLERLVWVRYQSHWWPALLYHSYSELQQHLYGQLDTAMKAQLAMAIMRQMQEKRKIKIARLLGRSILEVVEVKKDGYCEFYWQLPNVLPSACKRDGYEDSELYYDFHRALDQVEDIIKEVSEGNLSLMREEGGDTWLQRAKAADTNSGSRSKKGGVKCWRGDSKSGRSKAANSTSPSEPIDLAEDSEKSNPIFNAMDKMMETIARSFDSQGQRNETVEVNMPKTKAPDNGPLMQRVPASDSKSMVSAADTTRYAPAPKTPESREPASHEPIAGADDSAIPRDRVESARGVWTGVLGTMANQKEGSSSDLPNGASSVTTTPPAVTRTNASSEVREGAEVVANDIVQKPVENTLDEDLSLWAFLTCRATV